MSSLQKELIKSKLPNPGVVLPGVGGSGSSKLMHQPRHFQRKRDYEPVSWTNYFNSRKFVTINDNENDKFCVYTSGDSGPLLVLLHGGGYSALTWSLFTKHISTLITCQVMAIDLRGHGNTTTERDDDLSIETLSSDVSKIVQGSNINEPVILAGHSLGGAVAVRATPLIESVAGCIVIDVVEGTAMDALKSMQFFLKSRPQVFSTIPRAIEWSVRSGQVKNVQSAKVSVPGQIKNLLNNKIGTDEEPQSIENKKESPMPPVQFSDGVNSIIEEESATATQESVAQYSVSPKYTWRINLAETEKHWSGWFHGLSSAFLSIPVPKVLLLAGVDRLDKELTVGQMQGKFQLQVLSACGHAVQEDAPEKVAEAIATFLVRHKFAEPLSDFTWSVPAC